MADDPRVAKIQNLIKQICQDKKCPYKKGKKNLSCGKQEIQKCGVIDEAIELFKRTNRVVILRRRNG